MAIPKELDLGAQALAGMEYQILPMILPALISAGTTLIGGAMASSANERAADTATAANQEAARIAEKTYRESGDVLSGGILAGADEEVGYVWQGGQRLEGAQYEAAQTIADAQRQAGDLMAKAHTQAADMARAGYEEQARLFLAGTQAHVDQIGLQIDSLIAGNANALRELQLLRADNAPGMTFLRKLVADPQSLTPAQQRALNTMRQTVGNTIRGSGFAGSGRTAASLFRQVEADTVIGMQEANRQAAMQAAGIMAGNYNQAGMTMGQMHQQHGQQVGAAHEMAGQVAYRGARDIGGAVVSGHNATAQGILGAGEAQAGAAGRIGDAMAAGAIGGARAFADTQAGIGGIRGGAMRDSSGAIARGIERAGDAHVGATQASGQVQANTQTANGRIWGDALGSVGSVIADSSKQFFNSPTAKKQDRLPTG